MTRTTKVPSSAERRSAGAEILALSAIAQGRSSDAEAMVATSKEI